MATFRLRKSIKYKGMAFTALYLAISTAYAAILFLEEPAKHGFHGEHSAAIVGGMGLTIFGSMLLMSIYVWASYYVERLTIDGTTVRMRSIFQSREFDVSELKRVEWRTNPSGGSFVFHVLGFKTRCDLYGCAEEDRLRIIREVRTLVPDQLHEGWPRFCLEVALPLRDGVSPVFPSEPPSGLRMIFRKRYDRMFAIALPLSVVISVALRAWTNLDQFLVLPFLVVAAWLILRFNVPVSGRNVAPLTSTSSGRAQLIGWCAVVGSQLLMIALFLVGVGKAIACSVACVVLAAAIPSMLYLMHRSSKLRQSVLAAEEEFALVHWRQGEGAAVKERSAKRR